MLEKIHVSRWYNNASVLTQDLDEFFPSEDLNLNCKINSIARLSIYFGLFIIFTKRNQKWLSLSLLLLIWSLFIGTTEGFSDVTHGDSQKCVEPTEHNPFMNFTLNDYYENPDRPSNCPINTVRDKMRKKFLKRVVPDPTDLWGQNVNDRSFYTMPNTRLVNDQKGFAEWCYGKSGECKSNGENCLKRAMTRTSNGMFTSPI
jgi:hypothetical protein